MILDLLLATAESMPAAQALGTALSIPVKAIDLHRFPDGEWRVTLPPRLLPHTAVVESLHHPNDKLLMLLLAARTARTLGAHSLTLVAPYLCYMRQDIAFAPGEAVSQRIIGGFLAELFDRVVTIDPHLHRVKSLQDAVPAASVVTLTAAGEIGRFLSTQPGHPLLLGPDEESLPWVAHAARESGFGYAVCVKQRSGDHQVNIALPRVNLSNRPVILIDDMVSTGGTLATTAKLALAQGASSVDVAVTHALFANGAQATLKSAGVRHIWSANTVPHDTNVIDTTALLAEALRSHPP